ncbi:major facilitator superfamily protein [Xylariales sp. PMI_506]|nr:major facilitator superfamily protein [Xylariales sp. PMI_506]
MPQQEKVDPIVEADVDHFEKKGALELPDVDDDEEFSLPEQRKIVHKVDQRLLIVLGMMQAVSFIDRANISNAAVAGMTADLQLGIGSRYSIILLVFFAPYVAFQFPASILVRKIGPRIFLSSIVLGWGAVMIGFGFVKSWVSIIPLRAIIGAFEAGCFPSQYYLISCWYSRYDLYSRTAVFYLLGVFGSALTGVLGLAFSKMNGLGNLEGWRWIFIMEGLITCLIAVAGFVFVVDFPDSAHKTRNFLTEREAAFIMRRIKRDRDDAEPESFSLARFLRPALDLKIWAFALLSFCTTLQAYAVGFFLPVILNTKLGFSAAAAQGLSTPPYLTAMLLMFLQGVVSDRIKLRSPMLYFNALTAVTGLSLMSWSKSAGVQYFGAILTTAGPSANLPSVMVFQANNIRGTWKRAFSSASMIAFGGLGGIAGSLVFRSIDAPKYLPGIYCCLTANGVIMAITTTLIVYFTSQNRAAKRGEVVIEGLPGFRYTI